MSLGLSNKTRGQDGSNIGATVCQVVSLFPHHPSQLAPHPSRSYLTPHPRASPLPQHNTTNSSHSNISHLLSLQPHPHPKTTILPSLHHLITPTSPLLQQPSFDTFSPPPYTVTPSPPPPHHHNHHQTMSPLQDKGLPKPSPLICYACLPFFFYHTCVAILLFNLFSCYLFSA